MGVGRCSSGTVVGVAVKVGGRVAVEVNRAVGVGVGDADATAVAVGVSVELIESDAVGELD